MPTFTVTYWTGTSATVEASNLLDAFVALYPQTLADDMPSVHLWSTTGEVTNANGDLCATITGPISLVKGKASDCDCSRYFTGIPGAHTSECVSMRRVLKAVMRGRSNGTRVELLGNTSMGKIVRPEFAGQSIASGTLYPLTAFDY